MVRAFDEERKKTIFVRVVMKINVEELGGRGTQKKYSWI